MPDCHYLAVSFSKHIVLLRDPIDAAASALRRFWRPQVEDDTLLREMDAQREGIRAISACVEHLPCESTLILSYELLLAFPDAHVAPLARFLGVEPSDARLQHFFSGFRRDEHAEQIAARWAARQELLLPRTECNGYKDARVGALLLEAESLDGGDGDVGRETLLGSACCRDACTCYLAWRRAWRIELYGRSSTLSSILPQGGGLSSAPAAQIGCSDVEIFISTSVPTLPPPRAPPWPPPTPWLPPRAPDSRDAYLLVPGSPNGQHSAVCADATRHGSVRCCSHDGTYCNSICSWVQQPNTGVDAMNATWAEARRECDSQPGLRLCKVSEVKAGLCARTGCNQDGTLVWSWDACGQPPSLPPSPPPSPPPIPLPPLPLSPPPSPAHVLSAVSIAAVPRATSVALVLAAVGALVGYIFRARLIAWGARRRREFAGLRRLQSSDTIENPSDAAHWTASTDEVAHSLVALDI